MAQDAWKIWAKVFHVRSELLSIHIVSFGLRLYLGSGVGVINLPKP